MSTRSHIGFYPSASTPFKKWEALLYRHSDGYPDGMLPDLLPVLKDFHADRGIGDLEYAAAHVLHRMIQKNHYDGKTGEIHYPGSEFLGYGICNGFHGDIEYFYRVDAKERTLTVFECGYDDDLPWDKIDVLKLEEKS